MIRSNSKLREESMKAILTLSLVITVVVLAVIGCLVIVDVVDVDTGKELALKSLAAILVLGVSSIAVALLIRKKSDPGN